VYQLLMRPTFIICLAVFVGAGVLLYQVDDAQRRQGAQLEILDGKLEALRRELVPTPPAEIVPTPVVYVPDKILDHTEEVADRELDGAYMSAIRLQIHDYPELLDLYKEVLVDGKIMRSEWTKIEREELKIDLARARKALQEQDESRQTRQRAEALGTAPLHH
jgi:hypothetical protein